MCCKSPNTKAPEELILSKLILPLFIKNILSTDPVISKLPLNCVNPVVLLNVNLSLPANAPPSLNWTWVVAPPGVPLPPPVDINSFKVWPMYLYPVIDTLSVVLGETVFDTNSSIPVL